MIPYVVVILAPAREFFSAKCAQFPLTFMEQNQMIAIFPPGLLSLIFGIKFITKINFKSN